MCRARACIHGCEMSLGSSRSLRSGATAKLKSLFVAQDSRTHGSLVVAQHVDLRIAIMMVSACIWLQLANTGMTGAFYLSLHCHLGRYFLF